MTEITKIFSSDPQLLPDIEEWVLDRLKQFEVPQDKIPLIGMAVSEAAANSIIHGNSSDIKKKVTITIQKNNNSLKITLRDEGKGFSVDAVPDPTSPENMMKSSGRGIHIMKSVLDDLEYKFDGKGTAAILTIKL